MQYLGESLDKAAHRVVDDLFKLGGSGGLVAVDRQGNGNRHSISASRTLETDRSLGSVALPLNSQGMYRGVIRTDGVPLTAIFFDDELSEL